MTHRVTKIELKQVRGYLHVRAMGRTGRGTKFLITELVVPTTGRTKHSVSADRDRAIETLMGVRDPASP